MKCKHEWIKITEKTLESPCEQMGDLKSLKGFAPEFFEKKYICILQCKLCGKLDKTIESNPS